MVKVSVAHEGAVCLNGRFLRPDEATISPFDFGFLYGDGLFETLRTYGGRPFRLNAHLARLAAGLDALAIRGAPSSDVLRGWVLETIARAEIPDAYVRITVTRGMGIAGLDPAGCGAPTVFIVALPLRGGPPSSNAGVKAIFLWPRHPEDHPRPTLKSTSYQRSVLARAQLTREGAREGFFFDHDRHVTEGSVSNIFAVRGGILWTPPADSCLPGITRAEVLELARAEGLPTREEELNRHFILSVEELFITSSLMELLPVVRVGDATIGAGVPGPWTQRLLQRYREQTLLPDRAP